MIQSRLSTRHPTRDIRAAGRCGLVLGCLLLASTGCGAFNFGFVNLFDPEGTGVFATLDNAPGHVVIQLVNNATVNERLLAFLESSEGGSLELTDAEKRALRPRIRMRVRVTFTDGSIQTIEFVDGSSRLVEQRFNALAEPDLTQNTLSNAVVVCDVASVELVPASDIEVFIPVALTSFDLVQVNTGTTAFTEFVERNVLLPRFQPLRVDEVDADGNITLLQNIGTRDVPSPVNNVVCGSVITIVIDGALSVPFFRARSFPSFDEDDQSAVASVGGRYRISVTAN